MMASLPCGQPRQRTQSVSSSRTEDDDNDTLVSSLCEGINDIMEVENEVRTSTQDETFMFSSYEQKKKRYEMKKKVGRDEEEGRERREMEKRENENKKRDDKNDNAKTGDKSNEICRHFNKGSCKHGMLGKLIYVHMLIQRSATNLLIME